MKISLFYEFALPRPWVPDDERILLQDCLDEVEAADTAGFSTVWLTEHHFLEEYCHSTAPEMFLAAASQRTKNIRLGFGIMHLPPAVNHPARVAARASCQRASQIRELRSIFRRGTRGIQHRPRRQTYAVGGGARSLHPLHD